MHYAERVTRNELQKIGIDVRNVNQPVGTLSGGERQSVAIARSIYFGAKLLILDEPPAHWASKKAGVVLRYIAQARTEGLGVVFITHNAHHAMAVGDRFTVLNRGTSYGTFAKDEVSPADILSMMAGGQALEELSVELGKMAGQRRRPR